MEEIRLQSSHRPAAAEEGARCPLSKNPTPPSTLRASDLSPNLQGDQDIWMKTEQDKLIYA